MTKPKKNSEAISKEEQNAFDEIQHMFESSYVEPDQNVLELHPTKSNRKAMRRQEAIEANAISADKMEHLIQKHINDWMHENAPQIIRNILNKKIDELKK